MPPSACPPTRLAVASVRNGLTKERDRFTIRDDASHTHVIQQQEWNRSIIHAIST